MRLSADGKKLFLWHEILVLMVFSQLTCCLLSDKNSVIHLQVNAGQFGSESFSCSRAWIMVFSSYGEAQAPAVGGIGPFHTKITVVLWSVLGYR